MPDVAVIVITYNRPHYLVQTLDSLLHQTFAGSVEIVVVDDGSTDHTPDLLADYARRHGQIRSLRKANEGPAAARNAGFAATTAPLVAFVDDDDLAEPEKLDSQVQAFADPGVGLCHTSFRYIDQAGHFTDAGPQRLSNPCVGWCTDVLLNEFLVVQSTVMVRRSTMLQAAAAEPHGQPYDVRWVRAQDYDMTLRMSRLGRFAYIAQPLLRYRLHQGNNAMSEANIKRAFGYHCQVQLDFARRYGQEIGVNQQEIERRIGRFLHERAESHFWQRKLSIARQLCDLARELHVHDERFREVERRAARPRWMYQAKDFVDRLCRG